MERFVHAHTHCTHTLHTHTDTYTTCIPAYSHTHTHTHTAHTHTHTLHTYTLHTHTLTNSLTHTYAHRHCNPSILGWDTAVSRLWCRNGSVWYPRLLHDKGTLAHHQQRGCVCAVHCVCLSVCPPILTLCVDQNVLVQAA